MKSKHLAAAVAAFIALAGFPAVAQDFPSKPVEMIVPAPTGGASDIMARVVTNVLEADLGQPVPVINRGGGGGIEGIQEFVKRKADGHTVILLARSHIAQIASGEVPFKLDDFVPLGMLVSEPYVLVTQADNQEFDTLEKMVAYAKANPGKLTVGGYATKSASHLAAEQLFHSAGVQVKWLPLKGGAQVIESALGGHVPLVATQTGGVMQYIQTGKLKAIAASPAERSPLLPDVPTFREAGYDVAQLHWRAFFVKAGTPPEVVERLNKAISALKDDPTFQDYLKKSELDQEFDTPQALGEVIRKDHDAMHATMKDLKLIQ